MTHPRPTTNFPAKGMGPSGVTAGGDAASAKRVVIDMLQSGAGLVRAADNALNAHETAAMLVLDGLTTDDLDTSIVAFVNGKIGSALTTSDHWDDVYDAIVTYGA